jgi:alpha-beta hydrolase superfamily lysophospholipase
VQAKKDRISGMVLSSPFFGMAMKVPAVKVWGGKALSGIMPTLAMKSGLDPSWLSHDRSIVDQYAADPLVSNIATARWFTETLSAQEAALNEAGQVEGPLLVMQAGDDRVCSSLVTKRFFEVTAAPDKSFKLYEGFYHEIFNEVGRDQVLSDLFAWLESHRK